MRPPHRGAERTGEITGEVRLAGAGGYGYYGYMRSVNIADLKNNLSRYLHQVRRGEEILIRDRNLPIAKIIPLNEVDDLDRETLGLVAAGKLRLGEGPLPDSFWSMPGPRVSIKRLIPAVVSDREER